MTDTLSCAERSERMRRVRSRDTKPELALRRIVWGLGFRYRKNSQSIIGRPDLAFIGRKRVIFLHGCFWHRHDCRAGRRVPKSRIDFWQRKFEDNVRRDAVVGETLARDGWKSLVIWECQLANEDEVARRVKGFLDA
ncbi:very short patch repair endonuclease [Novosphingobium naphthalenivorans]|uniref:very short patch repair endonuclease n=1 Tax=Novosphingobium naphthalenivorans TaxID=273168 RepID=UPI00083076BB|nr:DNA mismatch endonuclease Vsr [Novosphingobium naphthalenivorans]